VTRARASAVLAAAYLVTGLACSRTPSAAGVGPPIPVASSGAAASTPSAASSAASGSSQSAALPDGCWSGFASDVPVAAPPSDRLKALAERCAQGMKPLERAGASAKLEAGQKKRLDFEVASMTGCVRVLAAGGAGIVDLALELIDARDKSRGADQLRAPFALAPAQGNVCLEPGKYHAIVSASSGAGEVVLSAYAVE
jgi:hypothetical protein